MLDDVIKYIPEVKRKEYSKEDIRKIYNIERKGELILATVEDLKEILDKSKIEGLIEEGYQLFIHICTYKDVVNKLGEYDGISFTWFEGNPIINIIGIKYNIKYNGIIIIGNIYYSENPVNDFIIAIDIKSRIEKGGINTLYLKE